MLNMQSAFATHSAGADIKYKYLSGNQYEVTVTFYRDCGGVAEPNSVTVNCKSQNGNFNFNVSANKVSGANGQEITFPCSTTSTTCNGGVATGIKKWTYSTVVTLPSQQSDWTFSYSICCRNCSITTINSPCSSNSVLYVEAKLNNLLSINNSSPDFTNSPVAFVCLGQNFNYNHGVVEPDGDSLFYELITPKTGSNSTVTFIPPSSVINPISSSTPFALNSMNGDINFTPNQMQIGVMAIRVKEYRNGQFIGSVIRDMQVYTQTCSNNLPTLSGINGGNNFTTSICANQQICFTVNSIDLDNTQSITLSCNNGIQNASYVITAGNRPSLNFCWTPSASDISNIPHTFTITVKDDACPTNGVQTFSYSILVNGPQFIVTSSNNSCNNSTSSQLSVQASGNYSYLWNNGATTSNITNITAGTYSVTATDQNGCTNNQTFQLTNNGIALTSTIIHPSCQGLNNGAIQLNISGGTAPYTYTWNNGATTKDIQQLIAGNYSVLVTDANGCTSTISNQLNNSSSLAINSTTGNISCAGSNNGWINTNAIGGVAPYTILWSNGLTQNNVSNLAAGNYSVNYTDAFGCSTQATFTINSTVDSITVDFTTSDIKCFGDSSGSINTIITGGTTPYSYLWSNNSTTGLINNLVQGVYTVTITDANGCADTKSVSISQPLSPLQITASQYHVACKGDSTGSIELFVNGSLGNYTYLWSNDSTTKRINNLKAGIYSVTVSDMNGCSINKSYQINEPDSILILSITNGSSPCSSSNSIIYTNILGGLAPYTYLWNTGATSTSITNNVNGNYSVTVTDVNGCSRNESIVVNNNQIPLSITSSSQNINCATGQTGFISINVNGGNSPYQYLWSNGNNNNSINNLTAGTYTVTVTDANGCSKGFSKTITDITNVHAQVQASNEICVGEYANLQCDSLPAATYQWYYNNEPLNGAITSTFTTPVGGTYYVIVSTACGTYQSNNIEIIVHALNHVQVNNDLIICQGESAQLHAAGGVNYQWTPAINIDNANFSDPIVTPDFSTDYTVTVTDQYGCSATATVKVSVMCDSIDAPNGFSPNNDGINDYFHIKGIEDFDGNVVFIYNRWGSLVFKQKNYDNKWDGKCNVNGALMGQDLPEGTYYFLIDLNNEGKPLSGYVVLKR
jgi:gliding motility-associated-like protein